VTSVPLNITINDDNMLEDDVETFTLTINHISLPDQVTRQSGMGQTTISIVDNDGNLKILLHIN